MHSQSIMTLCNNNYPSSVAAHIHDVQWHVTALQEIAITPEEDTKENASAEVAELKEKRTELQNSIKNAEQHIERLKSQDTLLTQYSSGLFSAGKNATTSDLLDQTTIGRIIL